MKVHEYVSKSARKEVDYRYILAALIFFSIILLSEVRFALRVLNWKVHHSVHLQMSRIGMDKIDEEIR